MYRPHKRNGDQERLDAVTQNQESRIPDFDYELGGKQGVRFVGCSDGCACQVEEGGSRGISVIQMRMRANPPPQSGVQCLGQARTLRFICFDSVIEPAERESRRAPRGKPARPCCWTHSVRPNWNPDLYSKFNVF